MNEDHVAKYIGIVEGEMRELREWLMNNRDNATNVDLMLRAFESRVNLECAFTEFETMLNFEKEEHCI